MPHSKATSSASVVHEFAGTDLDRFEASILAVARSYDYEELHLEVDNSLDVNNMDGSIYGEGGDVIHPDSANELEDDDVDSVVGDIPDGDSEFDPEHATSHVCESPELIWFDNCHNQDPSKPDGFDAATAYARQFAKEQGFCISKYSIGKNGNGQRSGGKLICSRGHGKSSYCAKNPDKAKKGKTLNVD
ncbi:hypothetical protein GGI24_005757, partial [Coemansia furcata]